MIHKYHCLGTLCLHVYNEEKQNTLISVENLLNFWENHSETWQQANAEGNGWHRLSKTIVEIQED